MRTSSQSLLPGLLLILGSLHPLVAQDAEELSRDIKRATASISAGNHETALTILDRVLARKPDLGLAWYQLAIARRALGKEVEAFRAAEEAERLLPESKDAKVLLAEMCARGDAQRACRIVSDLLAGGMEDLELLRRLLPVLVAAHDARTKQVFDALLKVTPQDTQLLQQKVLWALDNHDLPAAIEALQAHVAADPKNPLPLQSLANVQLAAGRNGAAVRTLEQLLALNPSNCAARQKVIGLLQQQDGGDPARALEHKKLLAFYQRQTARWQAEGRKDTSPTTQPPPPAPRK